MQFGPAATMFLVIIIIIITITDVDWTSEGKYMSITRQYTRHTLSEHKWHT